MLYSFEANASQLGETFDLAAPGPAPDDVRTGRERIRGRPGRDRADAAGVLARTRPVVGDRAPALLGPAGRAARAAGGAPRRRRFVPRARDRVGLLAGILLRRARVRDAALVDLRARARAPDRAGRRRTDVGSPAAGPRR